MSRNILIVEDDTDLAELARVNLQDQGFQVRVEHDGLAGLSAASEGPFDLILLDLMLPGMDGLDVCRRVRSQDHYTPIIILTARTDEVDRVLGLEMGADDYISKPFSLRELVARVKALFRRVDALQEGPDKGDELVVRGALQLDVEKRKVLLQSKSVDLTAKEFDLLLHFARHPGRVFNREDLLEAVWGHAYEGYGHTVNSHINRLRAKITVDGATQKYIETVWGVGYRFAEDGWV